MTVADPPSALLLLWATQHVGLFGRRGTANTVQDVVQDSVQDSVGFWASVSV